MAVATIYLGECYTVFKSEISLLSSGINEVEEIDNFHVFPNPANKHLDLSFDGIENVKQVEIIDQLGQQLLVREIDNQRSSIRINALKNLPAGQYFVALILSDKPAVYRKLIIVH
nr:T9SS type A sorting domain-containing protein [Portibacter lacus]